MPPRPYEVTGPFSRAGELPALQQLVASAAGNAALKGACLSNLPPNLPAVVKNSYWETLRAQLLGCDVSDPITTGRLVDQFTDYASRAGLTE